MAVKKKAQTKPKAKAKGGAKKGAQRRSWSLQLRRLGGAFLMGVVFLPVFAIVLYAFVNPPLTPYMWSERARLGDVRYVWTGIEDISPHMLAASVAAEDVHFCTHWGLDLQAIRYAIQVNGAVGGSTITQQVVKNVYLWHGRSYLRKVLEAFLTLGVEAVWSKERILEVYLNVAEFDEGVFGVAAAGPWYFGVNARDLTAVQAAQLAAVLPNPKQRSARDATRRARQIADGAVVIARDGRSSCFTQIDG